MQLTHVIPNLLLPCFFSLPRSINYDSFYHEHDNLSAKKFANLICYCWLIIGLSILAEILTAVYCAFLYFIALISQLVIDSFQSRSLYVKNLNFKTSDENLWKHVSDNMKKGKVLSVRVSTSHI